MQKEECRGASNVGGEHPSGLELNLWKLQQIPQLNAAAGAPALTCDAVRCPSVTCALVPQGTFPVRSVSCVRYPRRVYSPAVIPTVGAVLPAHVTSPPL